MRLDSRETEGNHITRKIRHGVGTGHQCRTRTLVDAPCAGRGHVHSGVGIDQTPVIVAQEVALLCGRQQSGQLLPCLRIDAAKAVEEPVNFAFPAEKYASQYEAETAARVRFGIGQRKGASPGTPKDQPAVDFQVLAQGFQIRNQMRGGVVLQFSQWCRAARAALVEHHDAIGARIKESPVRGRAAGSWPPVKEYDGNAIRAPAFLPVHGMHRIEPEHSRGARRNFRKQPLPCRAGCAVIRIHRRADDKLFPATPGHFLIFFRQRPFPEPPGAGYFPG